MNHSALVVRAATEVKRRPGLWLLGLLATVPSIAGSLLVRLLLPGVRRWSASVQAGQLPAPESTGELAGLIGLTLALAVAALLAWLVSLIAEAGLIWSVHCGSVASGASWRTALGQGRAFIGRLVAVDTILLLPLFLLTLAAALIGFGALAGMAVVGSGPGATVGQVLAILGAGGTLVGLLSCLMAPTALAIGLLRLLTFRQAVIIGGSAMEAIKTAWRVTRNGWVQVGVLALLAWGLAYLLNLPWRLISLLSAGGVLVSFLPATIQGAFGQPLPPWLAAADWLAAVAGALLGAVVHALVSAIWTLAYAEWSTVQNAAAAKL